MSIWFNLYAERSNIVSVMYLSGEYGDL